jgi:hypothetical protein
VVDTVFAVEFSREYDEYDEYDVHDERLQV